jgi:PAS domain S-box-containing protein
MPPNVTVDVLTLLCSTTVTGSLAVYGAIQYREGHRERRVLLFVLLVGMAALWALTHAGELLSRTESRMLFWRQLTQIPAYGTSALWLLFMFAYTDRDHLLTWNYVSAILVLPAIAIVLSLFAHPVIWMDIGTVTHQGRQFLDVTLSPVGLFFYGYAYLLAGTGVLLAGQMIALGQLQYRRQGVILATAAIVSFLSSVAYLGGFVPHPSLDPAPISFAGTGALLGYAIFRYDMLELVPIAHKAAFETLPDVVVVFDDEQRVVDMNPPGKELCDVSGDPTHEQAAAVFSAYPALIDRLFERQYVETEISLVVDGEFKHFSMTSRPVAFQGRHSGTLLILRDVTELKEREQDLELLKRIQSRVLRHNIRNDIQIIRGLAQMIVTAGDGRVSTNAEKIARQAKQLSETTEKAQQIESVLDASEDRTDQDVCQLIDRVAERARREFPGANIETDVPETAWAMAHGDLEAAIWNLTENAVVHSDETTPVVSLCVEQTDTTVTIRVEDNGPGIPDHEVAVLEEQSESALQHGSGAGLWLVNWIAEMSAGTLAFEATETGTIARLELPAAEHTLAGPNEERLGQPADTSSVRER